MQTKNFNALNVEKKSNQTRSSIFFLSYYNNDLCMGFFCTQIKLWDFFLSRFFDKLDKTNKKKQPRFDSKHTSLL
jgi:hypothetical protein